MPRFTTLRIGLPVCPCHAPLRTLSAKRSMRASVACTSGTTSCPSTRMVASAGARRATCSTARPSLALSFSPANIASMERRTS